MPLPVRFAAAFPPELLTVPIEDIDPYYQNQQVQIFVLLSELIHIFDNLKTDLLSLTN